MSVRRQVRPPGPPPTMTTRGEDICGHSMSVSYMKSRIQAEPTSEIGRWKFERRAASRKLPCPESYPVITGLTCMHCVYIRIYSENRNLSRILNHNGRMGRREQSRTRMTCRDDSVELGAYGGAPHECAPLGLQRFARPRGANGLGRERHLSSIPNA